MKNICQSLHEKEPSIAKKLDALNLVKERLKQRGWVKGQRHHYNDKGQHCSCLLGFLEDKEDKVWSKPGFSNNPLFPYVVNVCKNKMGDKIVHDSYNHMYINKQSPSGFIVAAVNNILLESKKDIEDIFFKIEQQLLDELDEVQR